MEILDKIKLLLPNANDDILSLLIDLAKDFSINYCNLSEYNATLDNIIVKMVLEDFNKLGSEGISAKSFSGISESYITDYSAEIYKMLNKHRHLKTL